VVCELAAACRAKPFVAIRVWFRLGRAGEPRDVKETVDGVVHRPRFAFSLEAMYLFMSAETELRRREPGKFMRFDSTHRVYIAIAAAGFGQWRGERAHTRF